MSPAARAIVDLAVEEAALSSTLRRTSPTALSRAADRRVAARGARALARPRPFPVRHVVATPLPPLAHMAWGIVCVGMSVVALVTGCVR